MPGIYFYDSTAVERTKKLTRSPRGELEITDLNQSYLVAKQLKVKILSRGTTWLDMGTPSSLLSAAAYVQIIQERQGLLVGSPEEAAWRSGWINNSELMNLANEFKQTNYGNLLSQLLSEGK